MDTQTKTTVTGQMIMDAIAKIEKMIDAMDEDIAQIKADVAMLANVAIETHDREPEPAAEAVEQHCPECGGDVWDNRQDPKRGKRPLMKCKDAACGWVTWKKEECEKIAVG